MAVAKINYFYEDGVVEIGDLKLESGKILGNVRIAFERVGPIGAPTILVCHALTGNQYAVGNNEKPGWWSQLIGPGKDIDTDSFQVITTNIIGGCSGSTGPLSLNPETGKPYRSQFPFVTVRDMVNAQYLALKKLSIYHLKAVIGGSLGGMQVLEWGILYPTFMDMIFPVAVTPFLSDYAIAFNSMSRIAITQDPEWNNGDYDLNSPPRKGLSLARMMGMVTYRSQDLFNERFNRTMKNSWGESHDEITFDIESYLLYQGYKLTERFDANSYLYLLKSMDNYDIGRDRGGWEKAITQIRVPIIALGFKGDLLYPPEKLNDLVEGYRKSGKSALFYNIETTYGHDGFLAEFYKWGGIIKEKLLADKYKKAIL